MTEEDFFEHIEFNILHNSSSAYCIGLSCSVCDYCKERTSEDVFYDCTLLSIEEKGLEHEIKLKVLNEKIKIKYFEYKLKVMIDKLK